jgi:hypothetical protein
MSNYNEEKEQKKNKKEIKKKTSKAHKSFDYDTNDIIEKISTR